MRYMSNILNEKNNGQHIVQKIQNDFRFSEDSPIH
jgi:hypothetical protein